MIDRFIQWRLQRAYFWLEELNFVRELDMWPWNTRPASWLWCYAEWRQKRVVNFWTGMNYQ